MFDSESVLFGGGGIDRAGHLREDTGPLLADPRTRTCVFWRGKAVFEGPQHAPRLAWLPISSPLVEEATDAPIFLGLDGGAPRFAHDISPWEDPAADPATMALFVDTSTNRHPAMTEDQAFLDLRAAMGVLDPRDAGDAAAAKGIFAWHETHRHCARCGAASEVSLGGWRRTCPDCGAHHFPRTDPVVIMLITHGPRLLMGRSPGWPEGMYSLLAGFMEPGETIEAAVRREVLEESGIPVGPVSYLSSQPWPFPASLMIGCRGEALDDKITLDPVELEDAFWITREELIAEHVSPTPRIRPARKGAIAHFLIDHWLSGRIPQAG
ncbi:NAD(+) diphosphatase [Oceanibium sediminis]|uniref:NAD(+) diphosphatase n=1 Tax=Oceanibium sediminis TaxID=2026339 RepID=UPI000DD2E669|nr:NAD(+) diphosphatase [Oceanibium sediminis]